MRQETSRRRAVALVVFGVIVVGLGAMLLIGVLLGDETDDPPQDQVIVPLTSARR
jgi:hypothetical protein